MSVSYTDLLGFVQSLTPTWYKPQHVNLALLLNALLKRPVLSPSELAREYPRPDQPLHGRLKRLDRFLDNPHLDEAALFVRWLQLSYRLGEDMPDPEDARPILPILLDTTYFEPFALLLASVPCGSRGLPVALTTYHRRQLQACFPAKSSWPRADQPVPSARRRGQPAAPASAVATEFLSQNLIEQELMEYLLTMISPGLHPVLVADRGFARASLFSWLDTHACDFVIRFDAETHIRVPEPFAAGGPSQGSPMQVLNLQPGQRIWCPQAWYGAEDQVPIRLLAVWEKGYKEPWYLATHLASASQTETLYRWRMRLECTNRDEKTGVVLREGGDDHDLTHLLHLHRLLLALATAEWLCALTGLQAWHDLPNGFDPARPAMPDARSEPQLIAVPTPESASPTPSAALPVGSVSSPAPPPAPPSAPDHADILDEGPSAPPPVLPHRGTVLKPPQWMRRFTAWGHLSYVRLGLEVLRAADLGHIVKRLVRWLGVYLQPWTPFWRSWQIRYRRKHWWSDYST